MLTEYRGLTVTELADLRAALRPRVDRLQGLQEHAGPPGRRRTPASTRSPSCSRARWRSPSCAGRRGGRGQGAARLRQEQPDPRREGRAARRPRVITVRRHRGAGRRCRPRDVLLAQLAGGFQAAAREGGRPVPGLHPQLRLRPQGADRPARRRPRKRPAEEARPTPAAEAEAAGREAEPPEAEAAEADARAGAEPETEIRATESEVTREKRTDGNHEQPRTCSTSSRT